MCLSQIIFHKNSLLIQKLINLLFTWIGTSDPVNWNNRKNIQTCSIFTYYVKEHTELNTSDSRYSYLFWDNKMGIFWNRFWEVQTQKRIKWQKRIKPMILERQKKGKYKSTNEFQRKDSFLFWNFSIVFEQSTTITNKVQSEFWHYD